MKKVIKSIKLTKNEIKLFDNICVCTNACRRMINEVVRHFEKNELAGKVLWEELDHKYNLECNKYEWTYNGRTKSVECLREVMDSKDAEDVVDRIEFQESFRKEVKSELKSKKKVGK